MDNTLLIILQIIRKLNPTIVILFIQNNSKLKQKEQQQRQARTRLPRWMFSSCLHSSVFRQVQEIKEGLVF